MLTAFHFLARAALTSLFALHSLARTELSPCSQEAQGLTVAPSGAGRPGPACLCRAAASSATPSARTGDRLVPRGVASPGKLCHELLRLVSCGVASPGKLCPERVSRGCSRLHPPPRPTPGPAGSTWLRAKTPRSEASCPRWRPSRPAAPAAPRAAPRGGGMTLGPPVTRRRGVLWHVLLGPVFSSLRLRHRR